MQRLPWLVEAAWPGSLLSWLRMHSFSAYLRQATQWSCKRNCACCHELDESQAFSCLQASLDKVLGQLRQHVKARGSSGGTLEELVSSLLEEHNSQVTQESSDTPVELHCLLSCAWPANRIHCASLVGSPAQLRSLQAVPAGQLCIAPQSSPACQLASRRVPPTSST